MGYAFLLLFISAGIVQGFTSDSLNVEILSDGDAYITFEYTLNAIEQVAVYLKVADPNTELKKALEDMFHHPVTPDEVTNRSARFLVSGFAEITEKNGTVVIKTPGISFKMAEEALKKYWFAPLVQADYSADVATIIFPDGHMEQFFDTMEIPATTHEIVGSKD